MCSHNNNNLSFFISFEVADRLGAFYSGGPVQLSWDGQHIFATCGNAVKVVSYSSGKVLHSIEEVGMMT